MATITFIIDDNKLDRVRTGILKTKPNTETIDDPEWADPEDGSMAPKIAKYTADEWIKELGRRFYVRLVKAGETKIKEEEIQNEEISEADIF